jgi:hypothetical protein
LVVVDSDSVTAVEILQVLFSIDGSLCLNSKPGNCTDPVALTVLKIVFPQSTATLMIDEERKNMKVLAKVNVRWTDKKLILEGCKVEGDQE